MNDSSRHPPIPGRRGLIRGALATIGAGLGVALAPRSAQAAQNLHCCRDSSCSIPCSGGQVKYRCTDGCSGAVLCICYPSSRGTCFTDPCL